MRLSNQNKLANNEYMTNIGRNKGKLNKLLVPSSLDLEKLISEVPVEFAGFKIDKVFYICDSIFKGSLKLDKETFIHPYKKEPYYVPLHTEIIKHYLGAEYYKKIVNWMVAAGIIEVDGSYQTEIISLGYRFTEKYRNNEIKKVDIIDFVMFNKKPSKKLKQLYTTKTSRNANYLKKWYDGLEINVVEASKAIATNYMNKCFDAYRNGEWPQLELEHRNNQVLIELYGHPDDYHQQDKNGRRLHTVVTCTPRYLRSIVTYKGQELAQTDISNSQLFFTLFLFMAENWKKSRKNQGNLIWEGLEQVNCFPYTLDSFVSSIMSSVSSKSQAGSDIQDDRFMQLVTKGKLYDYFIFIMNKEMGFFEPNLSYGEKRDVIKSLLIAQINGDSNEADGVTAPINFKLVGTRNVPQKRIKSKEKERKNRWLYEGKNKMLWDAFNLHFPSVAAIYRQIKTYDNSDISKVLQRIESTALLDYACAAIRKELPKAPLFTIHDCLTTTREYIDAVDIIFRKAIASYIGYEPKTKISYWSDYPKMEAFPFD